MKPHYFGILLCAYLAAADWLVLLDNSDGDSNCTGAFGWLTAFKNNICAQPEILFLPDQTAPQTYNCTGNHYTTQYSSGNSVCDGELGFYSLGCSEQSTRGECLSDGSLNGFLENLDDQFVIFSYFLGKTCQTVYEYEGFLASNGTYCNLPYKFTCLEDGNVLMDNSCNDCDHCGPETVTLAPGDCVVAETMESYSFAVQCNYASSRSSMVPFILLFVFMAVK